MNISAINFSMMPHTGASGQTSETNHTNFGRLKNYNSVDAFTPSFGANKPEEAARAEKQPAAKPVSKGHAKRRFNRAKAFAAGIVITLGAQGATKMATAPADNAKIDFNAATTPIERIADIYDSSADVIKACNDIKDNTDLSKITSLKIPSSYSALGEEEDKLRDKLYSKTLSDSKRIETEEKVVALEAKMEAQAEVADVYTDGKFIYFDIKSEEENPELILKYGKDGINSEDFKALFDIKDGELRKYNELSYFYVTDEDNNKTYKDYTLSVLPYDNVIKVSTKSLEKEPDLKGYYCE